jgi:hypothetical protein
MQRFVLAALGGNPCNFMLPILYRSRILPVKQL